MSSVSANSSVCPLPMLFPASTNCRPSSCQRSYSSVAILTDRAVPSADRAIPWNPSIPGMGSNHTPTSLSADGPDVQEVPATHRAAHQNIQNLFMDPLFLRLAFRPKRNFDKDSNLSPRVSSRRPKKQDRRGSVSLPAPAGRAEFRRSAGVPNANRHDARDLQFPAFFCR